MSREVRSSPWRSADAFSRFQSGVKAWTTEPPRGTGEQQCSQGIPAPQSHSSGQHSSGWFSQTWPVSWQKWHLMLIPRFPASSATHRRVLSLCAPRGAFSYPPNELLVWRPSPRRLAFQSGEGDQKQHCGLSRRILALSFGCPMGSCFRARGWRREYVWCIRSLRSFLPCSGTPCLIFRHQGSLDCNRDGQ